MTESNRSDLSFRGSGSVDCEDFISAVNRWAFDEQKDEDDRLVTRFAYSRMAGGALRFYETLDVETQASWRLLRQTLLAQYPPPDPTIPAPALAVSSTSRVEPCAGVIRLEVEGDQTIRYMVHNDADHTTRGETIKKDAATIFKLRQSSELQSIHLAKHAAWLGLRWYRPQAGRAAASEAWAFLTCVTEATDGAGCNNKSGYGPGAWIIWKYSQGTGLLEVCWPEDNGFHITETQPYTGFNPGNRDIHLYKDVAAYSKPSSARINAKLIFDPL